MAVDFDILVPGHYFCDIIFSGIPAFPALGTELFTEGLTVVPGGIMNTVVGLSRLGVKVGWMGTLGNDFFSRFVAETARAENVDLSLIDFIDKPFRQVTVALSYPEDRAFVSYCDPESGYVDRVFKAVENPNFKHLHFTGLLVDERIPDLLDLCHTKNIEVSMDCQHKEETLDDTLVKTIISKLDMFIPNAIEAQRLTKTDTVESAAIILSDLVPHLVIKQGAAGALSYQNGEVYHAPAMEVDTVVDTTGAGDCFNAGFLAAHLAGKSTQDCLTSGNIAGGLSLRGYGGYTTAPTLDELESYQKC